MGLTAEKNAHAEKKWTCVEYSWTVIWPRTCSGCMVGYSVTSTLW